MQIRKAVITAAAPGQNRLPLQQLVDRNGEEKTALQLILEQCWSSGIEDVCVVISPGDEGAFRSASGQHDGQVSFITQQAPRGYADALLLTRPFTKEAPFLHLVGDHLYLSESDLTCAAQLLAIASDAECAVSAVQSTRENNLPYFGIASGRPVPNTKGLYEVERVSEKPTPTYAEQALVTPGLRSGHYLGFFGMHVLTPQVMQLLEEAAKPSQTHSRTLSDALNLLPSRERYLAYQLEGHRCNLGVKYGLLKAQLAIGLSGRDREVILSELVELLSQHVQRTPVS
ncbi:sugar phosphate nucleotidyltransferase [bacterium]|nr:sugar phosphate nucleotidyltransferase [bacterium]